MEEQESAEGLRPELIDIVMQLRSPEFRAKTELSARMRTTWPELAETLRALTGTARDIFGLPLPSDGFEAVCEYRDIKHAADSPAAAEEAADKFPHVNAGNERVLTLIAQQIAAGIDHIDGLSILMATESPIRPVLAAARAVLLVGVRLSWIAGPDVEPRDRVGRTVSIELEHLRASVADLDEDDIERRKGFEEKREALLAAADRDGFVPGKKHTVTGFVTTDEEIAKNAASKLGRDVWRTLSSSAHVQDRGSYTTFALGQLLPITDVRNARANAVGAIVPAVVLAHQGLEHVARYLGYQTGALTKLLPAFAEKWHRGGMHWTIS